MIDEKGGDEIVPGDGVRDPLLFAYDDESIVTEHRFTDVSWPSAQLIRERLQRLWRVVADLAVALRDPEVLLAALRGMKDPPLEEHFHRAQGWSPELRSEIVLVALHRERIEWGAEQGEGSPLIGVEGAVGALGRGRRTADPTTREGPGPVTHR